jgi:hypothetical protein
MWTPKMWHVLDESVKDKLSKAYSNDPKALSKYVLGRPKLVGRPIPANAIDEVYYINSRRGHEYSEDASAIHRQSRILQDRDISVRHIGDFHDAKAFNAARGFVPVKKRSFRDEHRFISGNTPIGEITPPELTAIKQVHDITSLIRSHRPEQTPINVAYNTANKTYTFSIPTSTATKKGIPGPYLSRPVYDLPENLVSTQLIGEIPKPLRHKMYQARVNAGLKPEFGRYIDQVNFAPWQKARHTTVSSQGMFRGTDDPAWLGNSLDDILRGQNRKTLLRNSLTSYIGDIK